MCPRVFSSFGGPWTGRASWTLLCQPLGPRAVIAVSHPHCLSHAHLHTHVCVSIFFPFQVLFVFRVLLQMQQLIMARSTLFVLWPFILIYSPIFLLFSFSFLCLSALALLHDTYIKIKMKTNYDDRLIKCIRLAGSSCLLTLFIPLEAVRVDLVIIHI